MKEEHTICLSQSMVQQIVEGRKTCVRMLLFSLFELGNRLGEAGQQGTKLTDSTWISIIACLYECITTGLID